MATIRLIAKGSLTDVSVDLFFAPGGNGRDQDLALARAVMVALNTDRRALDDDELPDAIDDDRRGWWGDLDAATIWGGWPIGIRLWLMSRDKITDGTARQGSTIEKARRFIAEALQPFVDAKICTRFDTSLAQVGTDRISGTITIYRGPKAAIALEYQDVWTDLRS